MRSLFAPIAIFLLVSCIGFIAAEPETKAQSPLIAGFRPPAVPLIVFDPFMSIWSMADNLYDNHPQLWCGPIKSMTGAIRVDGHAYRFMGAGGDSGLPANDVIKQINVTVAPTQTYYTFSNEQVTLKVTFTTPTIPTDLDLLAQPITYITYEVSSNDGKEHQIELYFDQTAEIAVHEAKEEVFWSRVQPASNAPKYIVKMGTTAQKILGKAHDCDGINWGHAYIAVNPVDEHDSVSTYVGGAASTRSGFVKNGNVPNGDDTRNPRNADDNWPVTAVTWSFKVTASQSQSRYLTFAYDDIESINYFGQRLPPYWRRHGQTIMDVLVNATRDYKSRVNTCTQFDQDHLAKIQRAANSEYSTIASLSFRQTFGGCKLVWNEQTKGPLYFMKEISSDGDLQTVDVIFPASTMFLYTNPLLLELLLVPLMAYANNETYIPYNLAWAPHHLGIYPIGDIKPKDQENMPVEETGNMLMLIASLVKASKQSGNDYQSLIFPKYESLVKSWAQYLIAGKGVLPDPEDQLCTDDFLGPSPHNVNLALKGIVGLGCYVEICKEQGKMVEAVKYQAYTKAYVEYWIKNAADSDHYRLQYNLPNTWSLKYNLLYQYIVGADIFPQKVIDTEIAYYKAHNLNTYGIPLNNQKTFTKLDWLAWIAAMANNDADRNDIFTRIYNLAHKTPQRVPLTDWYDTVAGTKSGFQARPVVGGVYAWMVLHSLKQNVTKGVETVQIKA